MKSIKLVSIFLLILLIVACKPNKQDWHSRFTPLNAGLELSQETQQWRSELDFNGDSQADFVYFTQVKSPTASLPENLTIRSLSSREHSGDLSGGKHAIVIAQIHTQQALIFHENQEMNILDSPSWPDVHIVEHAKLSTLDEPELLKAKGDIIVIPTPAGIDTYLFFDGKDYQHYEPLELP